MRVIGRENVYVHHAPENVPAAYVSPGEVFAVDTELCSGTWLQKETDIWSAEKAQGPNPTVCVGVEGAEPGDTLAVDVLAVEPESLGYTVVQDRELARRIVGRDTLLRARTFRIEDGFIRWNAKLSIPIRPMVGTLGTSAPEGKLNSYGGYWGGNMDVQEVESGATVYLPVLYPGALLNVGDTHAIQGDGEIDCAGGAECRSRVTLRARLVKGGNGQRTVRAENAEYLMAIACLEDTDEAFELAAGELIRFIMSRTALDAEECYQRFAQVLEARCTQFVNPTRSYICKIKKRWLI